VTPAPNFVAKRILATKLSVSVLSILHFAPLCGGPSFQAQNPGVLRGHGRGEGWFSRDFAGG
jgi:hypothetical protein